MLLGGPGPAAFSSSAQGNESSLRLPAWMWVIRAAGSENRQLTMGAGPRSGPPRLVHTSRWPRYRPVKGGRCRGRAGVTGRRLTDRGHRHQRALRGHLSGRVLGPLPQHDPDLGWQWLLARSSRRSRLQRRRRPVLWVAACHAGSLGRTRQCPGARRARAPKRSEAVWVCLRQPLEVGENPAQAVVVARRRRRLPCTSSRPPPRTTATPSPPTAPTGVLVCEALNDQWIDS